MNKRVGTSDKPILRGTNRLKRLKDETLLSNKCCKTKDPFMRVKDSGHPMELTICVACPDGIMKFQIDLCGCLAPQIHNCGLPKFWDEFVAPRFCGFKIEKNGTLEVSDLQWAATVHLTTERPILTVWRFACHADIPSTETTQHRKGLPRAFHLRFCVQRFRFNVFTKQSVRCRGSNALRVFCSPLRTKFVF